jgi:predicted nucleic acid-binding protein
MRAQNFFKQVENGKFELVTSAVVQEEIYDAPKEVRELFYKMLDRATVCDITEEALLLQKAYLDAKIVTEQWSDDALHVALASVSDCEIIVSWNFRHIVHYEKIPLYNAVNILHGYKTIAIYSPLEIIEYERE